MQRLFILFLLVNVADIISSFFILKGESNPLYILFGNIWILYALKIALIIGAFLIIKNNKYETNFGLYMMIVFMLYGSFVTGIGVYSNIVGINNPQALEAAAQIPNEVKVQQYSKFITILYLIPSLFTLFAFKVYEWAHKYTDLK